MSETEALPPEAEPAGRVDHDWWADEPLAVVVYENRTCHVDRSIADGTYRVLRTADGHVIGTHAAGDRGYFDACQSANSVGGRPRRPRP